MSDTPSAELHPGPVHRKRGVGGEGGVALNEELSSGMGTGEWESELMAFSSFGSISCL